MALDPSLYPQLKANIAASPDLNVIANTQDGADEIARKYNLVAAPAFTVLRSRVPTTEVVEATFFAELATITASNNSRYTTIIQISPNGIVPSTDRRASFEDIFSGAAGANTRAKLGNAGTTWQRTVTRGERVYCTGTGTPAAPGALGGFEGNLSYTDVYAARNS